MVSKSSPQKTETPDSSTNLASRNIQLGRVSYQPWRKHLRFVSPSYRAKAFWGISGIGCLIFLWSVFQAFLAADLAALSTLDKFSFNYSMVFTIVIGLLLAGLCVMICFQGISLSVLEDRGLESEEADGGNGGRLELRQFFKKPRSFDLASYRYMRIISNELSQTSPNTQTQFTPSARQRSYSNALRSNSHTAVIGFKNATISLESQDVKGLETLKSYLDNHLQQQNTQL